MFHTEKDDTTTTTTTVDSHENAADILQIIDSANKSNNDDVTNVDSQSGNNVDLLDGLIEANGNDTDRDMINDQLIRDGQQKLESEINSRFPLVSHLIVLDQLRGEYALEDEVYQQKVEDLQVKYSSIRKTRPDGNCFYRAFIFSYFESLIGDEAEQERFLVVCRETRKGILDVLGFPDFTIDEFYEYFYEIVTMIVSKKITNAKQLLDELDLPAVYDNIIVYLRLLTSYYLQKESDFFSNFIEGSGTIGEFCKREVEPMYKESDHIHIIALSSVMDLTVRVVYMDRGGEEGKVNEHDFSPFQQQGPAKPPRVHLLYRPGHYDVLYTRAVHNAFTQQKPRSSSSAAAVGSSNGITATESVDQMTNKVSSKLSSTVVVVQQEEADSSEPSATDENNENNNSNTNNDHHYQHHHQQQQQQNDHNHHQQQHSPPQQPCSPKQPRLESSPFLSRTSDDAADEANSTQPDL